uniref:Perilipin n=1 Tax=Globodera pallida TaxID=36090 RepID=A0A183BXZ3_GLOPA
MDRTTYKDAVVATGALGIGVGLAATQFGLLIGSAATNLMLDCLISTKNAGKDALNRGLSIEQAIEKRIYTAIEATQEIAKNPSEQLTAHANTFLDIANSLSESILGIPRAVEDPESGLKDRVTFLASRIATRISSQTNERIIEPLQQQMCVLTEQLSKCIVLRQEWTFNKVSQLSASVVELRNKIESEAMRTRKNPGEVLLQIIRFYSSKLNNQMGKLRDRSSEVLLSSSLQKQIQSLTMYVQKLDDNFAKAESIDDVKQEVIEEAKHKLFDIARWSASLSLRGPSKDTAAEVDDNDDEPKQHLQKADDDDDEPKQHLQKADDDDSDDEPKNPLQEEEGESSEEQQ